MKNNAVKTKYDACWESLNSRPVPQWFGEAKFGIFIHWGLYSVPAYTKNGEYAEWYAYQIKNPEHPAKAFHDKTYGENFKYNDFAGMFKAELFNADEWAKLFEKSVVRPEFSKKGRIEISEAALAQMVMHCVAEFDKNIRVKKITIKYGVNLK